MTERNDKTKEKDASEEENQKWFVKEDLQDLAKMGGEFFKKTLVSGFDVFKEVRDSIPKEASQIITEGKEKLLKGVSQETARNLVNFGMERLFKIACDYRLEFSVRIRRNDEPSIRPSTQSNRHKK